LPSTRVDHPHINPQKIWTKVKDRAVGGRLTVYGARVAGSSTMIHQCRADRRGQQRRRPPPQSPLAQPPRALREQTTYTNRNRSSCCDIDRIQGANRNKPAPPKPHVKRAWAAPDPTRQRGGTRTLEYADFYRFLPICTKLHPLDKFMNLTEPVINLMHQFAHVGQVHALPALLSLFFSRSCSGHRLSGSGDGDNNAKASPLRDITEILDQT
jgi:hypothetical protein